MDVNSFFDGIGTEIISIAAGLLICAIGGYKVWKRIKVKQKQSAGDYSEQTQFGVIEGESEEKGKTHEEEDKIVQEQRSGEHAKQIQVGRKC